MVVVGVWTITHAVTVGTNVLAPGGSILTCGFCSSHQWSSRRRVALFAGRQRSRCRRHHRRVMIIDGVTELVLAIEAKRQVGRCVARRFFLTVALLDVYVLTGCALAVSCPRW